MKICSGELWHKWSTKSDWIQLNLVDQLQFGFVWMMNAIEMSFISAHLFNSISSQIIANKSHAIFKDYRIKLLLIMKIELPFNANGTLHYVYVKAIFPKWKARNVKMSRPNFQTISNSICWLIDNWIKQVCAVINKKWLLLPPYQVTLIAIIQH